MLYRISFSRKDTRPSSAYGESKRFEKELMFKPVITNVKRYFVIIDLVVQ